MDVKDEASILLLFNAKRQITEFAAKAINANKVKPIVLSLLLFNYLTKFVYDK